MMKETYVSRHYGRSRLQTGRSEFRTPEEARLFSVLQNLRIGCVAYAASYWIAFLGIKSYRVSNHVRGVEGDFSDLSRPAPRLPRPCTVNMGSLSRG